MTNRLPTGNDRMLVLFTDYGMDDPYVGQLKAVLAGACPGAAIIDLLHRAPNFAAEAGAHLLHALAPAFPAGSVFVAVVDPGVGGPRAAVVVEADDRWYVGPDNGLLSVVAVRAAQARLWTIGWRPPGMSDTFHGRDLFAPVAAALANYLGGQATFPADRLQPLASLAVRLDAADLYRIIFIDHYGNAWTGIRGVAPDAVVTAGGSDLPYSRTFAEVAEGEAFWHLNSSGLVEIAANRANAAQRLGLRLGDEVLLAGQGADLGEPGLT